MSTRVLLFTGKGGVGKTTTAAATALHLARAGSKVLVTSADPAHSLADSMGVELGSEPAEVRPRCWGQQLDARERLEQSWHEIRAWVLEVLDWAGVEAIEAEELAVIPGLDELFALTELDTLVRADEYDVIVVDCAPTAETIRLLSLPDILSWYMDRLFPASRRMSKVVGPVLGRLTSLPIADDTVFAAGQRFYDQLDGVRRILADPSATSARLVVNPERMVIAEARRTFTYLSLFGYQVDAVVVNRVLPLRRPLAHRAAGAPGLDRDQLRLAARAVRRAHRRRGGRARRPGPVRRRPVGSGRPGGPVGARAAPAHGGRWRRRRAVDPPAVHRA